MKRKNIEEKYKWNLEQTLKGKTVDFWKKQFSENCEIIISLVGKITKNINNFSIFEKASKDLDVAAGIIGIYIMNKMNEDTGNAEATKEKAMNWVKSSEHRSFDESGPFVNRSNIEFKLWDHCDSVPVE